jgi:hypothetical protein
MGSYHILLAPRIIILYRLFLLFCVYYGLLFSSSTAFCYQHNSTHTFPCARLHISRVLVSSLVLLMVLRVHVSCYPIFSFLPLFLSSHSGLFRLHLPHRWMTHIVQSLFSPVSPTSPIGILLCLFLAFPRSSLGFRSRPAVHPLPPFPRCTLSDIRFELFFRPSRNVCLHLPTRRISRYTYYILRPHLWLQRLSLRTYRTFRSASFLPLVPQFS